MTAKRWKILVAAVIGLIAVLARYEFRSESTTKEASQAEAMELARQAVAASVLVGGSTDIDVDMDLGTLTVRATRNMRKAWGLLDCDDQRIIVADLFSQWDKVYPDANAVALLSDTGRYLGYHFGDLGDNGYHCE